MSNDFFNSDGNPVTGSPGSSAVMRGEFTNVAAAFDKMPGLTGNGVKAVVVNAGGTALDVTIGTLTLSSNFQVAGGGGVILRPQTSTDITLPTTGTLATLAGVETFTNKAISGSANTITNIGNSALTNSSLTVAGHVVSLGGSTTLQASDLTNGVTGTGAVVLAASPTLTGHPTVEGVTSTGATGTGNLVFSASPTITGTLTAAAVVATGLSVTNSTNGATSSTVTNANGGTSALSAVIATNGTNEIHMFQLGTAWTTANQYRQGGGIVETNGPGGLTLSTGNTTQPIYMYQNMVQVAQIDGSRNLILGAGAAGASAVGVIAIANGTAPSASPANTGQLYVEAGALKYRGSAGNITVLGIA